MSRLLESRTAGLLLAIAATWAGATGVAAAQESSRFGFGRTATPAEIAGWDIDVRPDGHGIRKGKGNARDGQAVYDAKCASCHGTFGESNNYMVIAGGVSKDDLKTGRAASLRGGEVRTVGNKLATVTTLWDYINRAMPWTAPQSLSVDEVYAVTAYVLHLNEIVPEDFELSDQNLLKVQLPNRNGMTTNHGMASVKGRPDVQGSLCMKDCFKEVKVTSELPEFARNAHGNLAEQKRPLGPMRGIDTTRYEVGKAGAKPVAVVAAASAGPSPQDLMKRQACTACHGISNRIVGPGFNEVVAKHGTRADAEAYLTAKIKEGGVGVWGQVPMPAQPGLKDDEARVLAKWILGGAK
ncbi:MAG: c-type cytochrome [Burkholderiaceae bacterium]|jgi:S-disulfanyl-L-cysteine oxidoreductase SoxD|nr:c-type cytochrome [Burkholderiaceae bacterium]